MITTTTARLERGRRGLVLITTMIIMCFLVMLATMLTVTTLTNSGASFFDHEKEVAFQIAQSGLDYAVWRVENDPYWEGGGSIGSVVVESGDLNVTEKSGLVLGTVYDKSGQVLGEFKLVFKADTTSPPLAHVSCNNILGFLSRTTASGKLVAPGMVYLAVEGRTFAGSERAIRVKRTVESLFVNNSGNPYADGVAYAGTDMSINILDGAGRWIVDTDNEAFTPAVRASGNITAANAGALSDGFFQNKGKIFVGDNKAFTLKYGATTTSPPAEQMKNVEFPRLEWEYIKGKYEGLLRARTDKIEAPAGTYVWTYDKTSKKYTLRYYPGDYGEGTDFSKLQEGHNVFASSTTGVSEPRLVIAKPLTVTQGVSGTTGCFKVMGKDLPERLAVYLVPSDLSDPDSVPFIYNGDLAGQGDKTMYFGGELSGTGTLVSQGDIRFGGRSILAATNDTLGLMFYTKGDVVIDPIRTKTK